jgi:hypothetical protein
LEFFLLLKSSFVTLLVVHVGVGSFPDGVTREEYLPCQVDLVLDLLLGFFLFGRLLLSFFSALFLLLFLIGTFIKILKALLFQIFIETSVSWIEVLLLRFRFLLFCPVARIELAIAIVVVFEFLV